MTTWVMIPARNEEQNIAAVIEGTDAALAALGHCARFVVVDDGSSDATVARAQGAVGADRREIISLPASGIGTAFNRGISAVLQTASDDDRLLLLEGDGTSNPRQLPVMLETLRDRTEVVIASRFQPGGGYQDFPWLRRQQSCAVNWLFGRTLALPRVRDYTIFYRAYIVAALRRAWPDRQCRLRCPGFEANTELLLRLLGAGATVAEVPYVYDYSGKMSYSKLPTLKTIMGHLRLLARSRKLLRGQGSQ